MGHTASTTVLTHARPHQFSSQLIVCSNDIIIQRMGTPAVLSQSGKAIQCRHQRASGTENHDCRASQPRHGIVKHKVVSDQARHVLVHTEHFTQNCFRILWHVLRHNNELLDKKADGNPHQKEDRRAAILSVHRTLAAVVNARVASNMCGILKKTRLGSLFKFGIPLVGLELIG